MLQSLLLPCCLSCCRCNRGTDPKKKKKKKLVTLRSLLLSRLPSIPRVSPNPSLSSSFSTSSPPSEDDDWTKPQPLAPNLDAWGEVFSWSTGLTKAHFDGSAIGRQVADLAAHSPSPTEIAATMDEEDDVIRALEADSKKNLGTYKLLKQVREPGASGE